MSQVDGDSPGSASHQWIRQGSRYLEKTLTPDEIRTERGSQGITLPTGAMYLAATFANQGVIHHHHQRFIIAETLNHFLPYRCKQSIRIKPLLFKKPVGCRPVSELLRTGAEHAAYGPPSQSDQRTHCQGTGTLECALLSEGRLGLVE